MIRRRLLLIILIFVSLFTTACTKRARGPRFYLDDDFYWALGNKDDEVEDAEKLSYQKLPALEYKNLRRLPGVGYDGKYVWLKVQFELPEELKNDDLSMLIPYLHFADELYLNGYYIDDYGIMGDGPDDPAIQEAGLIAHLFDFPESFLNQEGINTVYIKVLSLGSGSITPGVFIGQGDDAWATSDIMTFWRSRIYIFLEGFMLCVFIFFLLIFIAYKTDRIYFYLSFLSLFSMFFFSGFFGGDLPWVGFHGGISYLTFYKFTKCICFFALEYTFTLFIFDFLQMQHSLSERITRCSGLAIAVIITCAAPNYYSLIRMSHIVIWICLADIIYALYILFKNLFKGERRERARIMLIALSPFLVCFIADFIIKSFVNNITLPYFSMFGWEISIIICFLYFSTSYNRIARRLEYLNTNLKAEIKQQTERLMETNKKLEHERDIANQDMKMAALIQQKFFHVPQMKFKNWDYAVCYEPLSDVSGDLFNFSHKDNILEGLWLFDASGHGVAASLVTMLAENIIRQVYNETKNNNNLAQTLSDINTSLIDAKGDIDNFLTGLLLSYKENKDGNCNVSIASAAHPYPLIYKRAEHKVHELSLPKGLEAYGPIGINGILTKYQDFSFTMEKGDVLVLFTDGLTEMKNSEREDFGKDRLETILLENGRKNAQTILQALIDSLNSHTGEEMRTDDVTVIILKRK